MTIDQLVDFKHQWLLSQVDVLYPTPKSVLGKTLYQQKSTAHRLMPIEKYLSGQRLAEEASVTALLVDFHKLTVMFSLVQAQQWTESHEQEAALEFFSQIILDDCPELYLGLVNGKAHFACVITKSAAIKPPISSADDTSEERLSMSLMSDLVFAPKETSIDDGKSVQARFIHQVMQMAQLSSSHCVIEIYTGHT